MTNNRDELNNMLHALGSYFATQPGVQAAWLFGSHSDGRSHRESDVDVGVLLGRGSYPDERSRFEARVAMTADIIAILHRNDVDLVVLNDASPRFARAVVLDGERIHCSSPEGEHAFRRDVQLRAADIGPFLDRTRRIKLAALSR